MISEYEQARKKTGEYGVVTRVVHPLIDVVGLPHASLHELVLTPSGERGEIIAINEDSTKVMMFCEAAPTAGCEVVRTGASIGIALNESILGKTVDPFGCELYRAGTVGKTTTYELYRPVVGIAGRVRISRPFVTGTALIDALVPLGCGQRELVIGDRGTGKTSFILTTIATQIRQEKTIVVYAAIGRKKSEIKQLEDYFIREKLFDHVVMCAATADDPQSIIVIAPYAATAIAEYFRDAGNNVLLVLDDLSTHAKHYREVSLLAARFPGRDSYPGNIFSLQAHLMERAGNFKHAVAGEVAITCLPIVETIDGELTSYIPTNVMGMTDGHIFFDTDIHQQGRTPAVNVGLSVTRVGRQTQNALSGEITQILQTFLNRYERIKNYAHFGSELSPAIKNGLRRGDVFYQVFNQDYTQSILPLERLVLFGFVWSDQATAATDDQIEIIKQKIHHDAKNPPACWQEVASAKTAQELLNITKKYHTQLYG